MTQELNFEQQKLVEDNHNMIYAIMKRYNLDMNDVEDWYGVLAIGLCKAALAFEPEKGLKFSTLAYTVMENEVKMALRKKRVEINAYSLDEPVGEDETLRFGDMIESREDLLIPIELNEAINIALSKLNENERSILDMCINTDYTQREVAKEFGVAQPTVSRVINKYIGNIKKYFSDNGHIIF